MLPRDKCLCSDNVNNPVHHNCYFVLALQTRMCSSIKHVTIFFPCRETALVPSFSMRVNSAAQSCDALRIAHPVDKGSIWSVMVSVEQQKWQHVRVGVIKELVWASREQKSSQRHTSQLTSNDYSLQKIKVIRLTGSANFQYTCRGVSQVERGEQKGFELTVKLLVPGDECRPHTLAAVFHQVLKVQFALLIEVFLHLQRAAGVSLRTEAQVLTCGEGGIDSISFTAGGPVYLTAASSLWSKHCDWATFITEPIKENQAGTNRKG